MKIRTMALLALIPILVASSPSAEAQLELPRLSQQATVTQRVGLTDVSITYSRPGVKGRVIWGQLVPYGPMWRTGANEATTIEFSGDVTVNGHEVPAGIYSLFTIPRLDRWTIILNSDAKLAGTSGYDAVTDVARFDVSPEEHPFTEWMMFQFPEVTQDSVTAALVWERLKIPFTIEADTTSRVLDSARAEIAKMQDWRTPYRAASFAFEAEVAGPEAMDWIDQSIGIATNYTNLSLKARMLARAGQFADAIRIGEQAIAIGKAAEPAVNTQALEEQVAEWRTAARP